MSLRNYISLRLLVNNDYYNKLSFLFHCTSKPHGKLLPLAIPMCPQSDVTKLKSDIGRGKVITLDSGTINYIRLGNQETKRHLYLVRPHHLPRVQMNEESLSGIYDKVFEILNSSNDTQVTCSDEVKTSLQLERPSPCLIESSVDTITTPKVRLVNTYLALSKIRLTGLVVCTSFAGYMVAPFSNGLFSHTTLLACLTGTALCSCAANTINQLLEVPYDSQMKRTKNRPLVRGTISPLHAFNFALATSTTGVVLLYNVVNPLTCALGVTNLLLYIAVYTPLKRTSIFNTWVGGIVGAIPPLMGWSAATGGYLDPGAFVLFFIMYAWQFPHFNALSWNIRDDYSRAGYRMTAVINPELCKRGALRYSLAMMPLCCLAPLLDMTTWHFVCASTPLNAYLTWLSWRFYSDGDSTASRKLFLYSLLHLPALFVLLIVCKRYAESRKANVILPVSTQTRHGDNLTDAIM